ncbi:MAG: DNA starvation/stationary phase protection protein [Flavobacteriales bacterium]|nr:DNA starvation/stationary phase protection protein [Flavobacteriales bacterium]
MNRIGIEQKKATQLVEGLNELLANYQIFYSNVRGFHWNIKGEKFFELHVKFEELYTDLQLKIDEIAERILTLGGEPEHRFSIYLQQAQIKETTSVSSAIDTVNFVLRSLETLLVKQRAILTVSGDAEDEGTNSMMSDYIREQEKLMWMYNAFTAK